MNQLCKVCAEPAAGFHFGAFTCEGCKSFFGRTYNNLSQIHECKNGRQCVINKQNRTSCKACRLRKCIEVGMSKNGSRYGRRSNWFKIHCILQEQCGYNSSGATGTGSATPPIQSFRTPVTPTLQDGSLPFVNSQLRDALHSIEPPPPPPIPLSTAELIGSGGASGGRLPLSSPPNSGRERGTPTSCASSVGPPGGPEGPPAAHRITANFAMGQIGAVERQLQEEALNALRRGPPLPTNELEATYREQLLEALRRTHGYNMTRQFTSTVPEPLRLPVTDSEQISRIGNELERVRRSSADSETRLMAPQIQFEWDNNAQDGGAFSESESIKSTSPHSSKVAPPVTSSNENSTPNSHCSPLKLSCPRSEIEIITKRNNDTPSCRSSGSRSPCHTPKSQIDGTRLHEENETPMTEEERLSFLKSASKISSSINIGRDNLAHKPFPGLPAVIPHNVLPQDDILYSSINKAARDDIIYSPINNNIFPFSSYPPLWHSLIPFPNLAKFYPPIGPAALPAVPLNFDSVKNSIFISPELKASLLGHSTPDIPKEDPTNKKKIIDAILQVQRDSSCSPSSPCGTSAPMPDISVALTMPQLVTTVASTAAMSLVSPTVTTTTGLVGDQPIDLTVRRKRKMAKSEIRYKPGEDREDDMESEYTTKEEREEPEEKDEEDRMDKEIFVKGTSEIIDIKTTLECSTSSLAETKFEIPMKIMKLETSGETLIS